MVISRLVIELNNETQGLVHFSGTGKLHAALLYQENNGF